MKIDWTKIKSAEQLIKYGTYTNYIPSEEGKSLIADFYLLTYFLDKDMSVLDDNLAISYQDALHKNVEKLKQIILTCLKQCIASTWGSRFCWGILDTGLDLYKKNFLINDELSNTNFLQNPVFNEYLENINKLTKKSKKYREYTGRTGVDAVFSKNFNDTDYMSMMLEYLTALSPDQEVDTIYIPVIETYLQLLQSSSINSSIILIDHALDLEHNTGSILDFSDTFAAYDMQEFLTFKSTTSFNIWELQNLISFSLRPLASQLIYKFTNQSYEQYNSKIDFAHIQTIDDLIKYGEQVQGGKADKLSIMDIAEKHDTSSIYIKDQLEKGAEVEKEHTNNKELAEEIAKDHLAESPQYYVELDKMEKKL